ncbi:flagellar M-ring protein FliF [Thiospirochaeta perfilievii]|uniref:Flagellar M-ring protein FliF n=1 Tax=Thiospirochaeta perfilievii TaxID=252967 RepID=A0A5C1QAP6_9SPIO|nr:flagellar basal-body MS-ring/collar protein FliF [Thiospirochaeta perfilievii]QEN03734.1 flagellar M-ring protein FliF [Thiospirochaeta perfilievii]
MDFIKKIISKITSLWSKWSLVQKIILIVIVVVVIGALSAVVGVNAGTSAKPLYLGLSEEANQELLFTLNDMNQPYTISSDGTIMVESEYLAKKIRTQLVATNSVPGSVSGFDMLGTPSFTETQWDKDQKLQMRVKTQLEYHIETLDSIDDASVTIVIPEKELFKENQKPNTVSVSLRIKHGSNFASDRSQIQGVERLIMTSVVNLNKDNITIVDRSTGKILNVSDEDMAEFDRLALGNKEMDQKTKFELKYKESIENALFEIFTEDRVALVNLDITLNTDVVEVDKEEHTPIITTKDNPATGYSEEVNQESIEISRQINKTEFQGSGFTPEGPAGAEGQTPPQYQELDTMAGTYNQSSEIVNKVVNTVNTKQVKSQWKKERTSVAVNIDGKWEKQYDKDGNVLIENGQIVRKFIPLTKEDILAAEELIKHAINYDIQNGDSVTVQAIQFDRTSEFELENKLERDAQNRKKILLFSVLGFVLIVIIFVIMRMVSKELERRRRLKEEEMARQHQAMREAALRSAEEDGMEVEMSVEDRARLEMQEQAINVAREHPEDVAQLIRTWLSEE